MWKRSVPSSEISNFRLLIMTSGTSGFSLLLRWTLANAKQGSLLYVHSQLTNLSRIKEPRIDSPWKRQFLKARWESGESLISSSRHGYCDVFLWKNVLNVFGSGRSDVRSGTSMTTRCEVKANMDSGNLGNKYCTTKHESSYPQIVYW